MSALILCLVLSTYAPQQVGSPPLADPAAEARVERVGKQLRCPVCQGMSIADSPSNMARAQMEKVREMVRDGKTDAEIFNYFVDRYDEWVLLEPRREGLALLVWVGPMVVIGAGLLFVFWFIRARNQQPTLTPAAPAAPGAALPDDEYLRRVRAELDR